MKGKCHEVIDNVVMRSDLCDHTYIEIVAPYTMGRQGGFATKKKRGKAHYSRAGKIGMAKRWAKKTT